ALPRPTDRALSGAGRPLQGALADQLRRAAAFAGDSLPRAGGRGRAAEPGGDDGGGAGAEWRPPRLPAVRGRATRVPQGGDQHPLPRSRALLLRANHGLRAGRGSRAGRNRRPQLTTQFLEPPSVSPFSGKAWASARAISWARAAYPGEVKWMPSSMN